MDSTVFEHDLDKANAFNKYFHSVFSHSTYTLPDNNELPSASDLLSDITVSSDEVHQALISLQPNKASGPDNIGPRILKNCAASLTLPLRHLFLLSLNSKTIPGDWKEHTIIPVFKSGDKSSLKNYRPISLLCSISKVLESLIYNKVVKCIGKSISSHQFGFQKHKSTLQQLLLYFNDLCISNNPTDTMYLDFTKAFDSVPHNELLLKLWSTGITGNLWKWFECYLKNRIQRVSVNNCLSTPLPVISGVPQGSILGPLLFLIYINDLPPAVTSSKLLLFADDTKCYKTHHNLSDCNFLQLDLDSLTSWSHTNHLFFKASKCISIRFKPNSETSEGDPYSIDGCEVSKKVSHRDLGIIFSTDMSWSCHYDHIITKAYRALGLLRRSFKCTNSIMTKKVLYLRIVRSCLLYCSPLWRPHQIQHITLLERVQRRASKYILNDYTTDYKTRLIRLNLLPLMYIYELTDILFFVKSIQTPSNSFNITDPELLSFSTLNTRSMSRKLCHKTSNNNTTLNSYFFRLPRLWNSLPIIDVSLSYNIIKKKLISFLWSHFLSNFDPNNSCTTHFVCPCCNCAKLPHTSNFTKL